MSTDRVTAELPRDLWLTRDETCDLLGISARSLTNYVHRGLLRPRFARGRLAFEHDLYDPKEILSLLSRTSLARASLIMHGDKSAIDDFYVTPGTISQVEFRTRYGYVCKRVPCATCQLVHARGNGRVCPGGEASGTRYCVRRSDGSHVCSEIGAIGAWKTAHRLEQDRLAPILIARDALVEGRIVDAVLISNQLSHDLATPLRREIANAVGDLTGSAARRYACHTCGVVYSRWTPRCSKCLSLDVGIPAEYPP